MLLTKVCPIESPSKAVQTYGVKRSIEITLELNGQPEGKYTLTSCIHIIEELEKTPPYKINITNGSGGKYTSVKTTFGNRLGNS